MWIVELKLEPTDERLAARPAHREKLAAVDDLLNDDAYYVIDGVTVTDVREWRPFIT